MLTGNLGRIQYANYDFFVGVYPNDVATRKEVQRLANSDSRIHFIVNSKDGPTSKGQMLNEVVRGILWHESRTGVRYDALLMHDSEDLIHPEALRLINAGLDHHDFLQIPVFSLPVSPVEWVAGTYMDEFSEVHTKDILVRQSLGAAIPSAGVGTALSRKLVTTYLKIQEGNLLNPRALTEDYELGVSTKRHGLSSAFLCRYIPKADGTRDYIATREYFPKSFTRSIRQKTRWTLGISFQGAANLGWYGNLFDRWFLTRDRKGPFNHLIVAVGLLCALYAATSAVLHPRFVEKLRHAPFVLSVVGINSAFMVNRVLQRIWRTSTIYGGSRGLLSALRLPLVNVINAAASLNAIHQFARSKLLGIEPHWEKTEHELPPDFGNDLPLEETA